MPFSLVGLTLAIFIGFRNGTSYARCWEARTLWGEMLNEARSLLRQALTLPVDASHARLIAMRLIAFVHATRHQLRGSDCGVDMARLLPQADCLRVATARYRPAVLLLMTGEWLRYRLRDGTLAPPLARAMELPLGHLTDALGGCERIASAPIPFTDAVMIHRTSFLCCLLLPFGARRDVADDRELLAGDAG